MKCLSKLKAAGVIAVVRGSEPNEALQACQAVVAGGMKGIEVTFTIPQAEQVITQLVEMYQHDPGIVIGAGTVLDATTARLAILAGAEFIVSPYFDAETASLCGLYQIPYLPGCLTITEMKTALQAGVDLVKLFPGSAFGPEIIKAFKAPLPQLNIMPTGGVNLTNLARWFEAGATCVGVGGSLFAAVETGEFDKVTQLARAYMTEFENLTREEERDESVNFWRNDVALKNRGQ